MGKVVEFLSAALEPNPNEQTKRYIKTFPFPEKVNGKGVLFINNDGKAYVSIEGLQKLGITPESVKAVHITVEVEKK